MDILSRFAAGLAALLLAPALALGHAIKTETTPADGATLSRAPAAIEMSFDTPVRITLVEITDRAGETYEVDYTRGEPVSEFTATPAELPPGRYTVEWRGLSDDGHPASGTFAFTIN
jgi:methionine-rich copper-binding protein CopC